MAKEATTSLRSGAWRQGVRLDGGRAECCRRDQHSDPGGQRDSAWFRCCSVKSEQRKQCCYMLIQHVKTFKSSLLAHLFFSAVPWVWRLFPFHG